ncbi:MAG: phosphoribosylanthranilate isomerase [Chloroflexota bacterium]
MEAKPSNQQPVKVKICGITTVADALRAAEAGADYIGVIIEIEFSPRRLSIEQARPICKNSVVPVVTLFFNWDAEQIKKAVQTLQPKCIQLQGLEPPSLVRTLKQDLTCEIWKAVHFPAQGQGQINTAEYLEKVNSFVEAGVDAIILDTVVSTSGNKQRYGGTGQVSDWTVATELVKAIPVRTFLAGGINPGNVRQAIEQVRPYGVDLCSGVEASPGTKDPQKLVALMAAVREANKGVR